MNTLFIYSKGKKGKVLDLEESKEQQAELSKDGWKHTTTVNPKIYIEHLVNLTDWVDIATEVLELTEPNN